MDRYLPSLGAAAYRDVPAFGHYDVVVVGGGPAGIAASTTAAELGHKTLLIERLGYCGGAAVSGMSGTICGLYLTVEEPRRTQPQQVIFGFAERFRAALEADGGVTRPQIYGKSWVVTHDCATYKRVATDLVRAMPSVDALYHTQVIDVVADDDSPRALVLHTKSGFAKVSGTRIVDASGDADVVFKSGLRTTKGNNGVVQNPTMMFKVGNVDVPRYLDYWGEDTISPPKVISMLEARDELVRKKVWLFPYGQSARNTGQCDQDNRLRRTRARRNRPCRSHRSGAVLDLSGPRLLSVPERQCSGLRERLFHRLWRRGRCASDPLHRRNGAAYEC